MTATLPARIGKYEVERLLGSGGMGRVLLARDPLIGRQVAIKQIRAGTDAQARQRFLREAQTMGRLNHPNVTTLLEFGIEDDAPYLVLELLSGEDLSQWMQRPHLLREQLAAMLDIARGLQAAHAAGILHRDLKPDNVRVLESGHCKLLDFGIADAGAGHLTESGYFVGTPDFLAPEVITGQPHSQASDLYALGLLCYVLLKGDNPLHADTIQATIARVVHHPPTSLERCVVGVPAALARIIDRCLDKQPARRPQQIGELIEVLERCLANTDADARVSPATTAATQPLARDPVLAAVPAARRLRRHHGGLAALAAALLLLIWTQLQTPPEPPAPGVDPEPLPAPAADRADAPTPAAGTTPAGAPAPGIGAEQHAVPAASPAQATPRPAEPPAATSAPATSPAESPATSTDRPAPALPLREREREPAPVTGVAADAVDAAPPAATTTTAAESPAAPVDATPAAASAAPPATIAAPPPQVAVSRVEPDLIRAGRSTRIRLDGQHLQAVSQIAVSAGGTDDPRFRVSDLRHFGEQRLELTLSVARGVPLGNYALSLRGEGLRGTTVLIRVSL